MTSLKAILETFTKAELVLLSQNLGHGGWSVFAKAELVERLAGHGHSELKSGLAQLPLSTLKTLSRKLGHSPVGSNAILIERMFGPAAEKPAPPRQRNPKPSARPSRAASPPGADKAAGQTSKATPVRATYHRVKPAESGPSSKARPAPSKTEPKAKKQPATPNSNDIETRLWSAADKLWANTGLKPSEFSTPVLGLIFLRYAESKFKKVASELHDNRSNRWRVRENQSAFQAQGAIFLPDKARFSYLQQLPEGENIGRAINDAMNLIEAHNEDLRGVLPKNYNLIKDWTLIELLKLLGPVEIDGDAFGKVYEYFLGNFAMAEGRKGGVFYTPISIVRLIVEIIEPFHGKVFDPACGSGGMFVQSARFVDRHNGTGSRRVSVYGTEKESATIKLCKMNLAVHGLAGDIREANTYYEDPHKSFGKFDFVMANPPFNVSGVDKQRLEKDPRFALGLPNTDNANYLWIQIFYHSLNPKGRAGFVMANSAADARATELEVRKKLIQSGGVDVVVSIGSNFFYTVTLPCTLWFFDRGKTGTDRADKVLFLDARNIYQQLDRAHRDFTPDQIEFLANIVRLYRGDAVDTEAGSEALMDEYGIEDGYVDIPGLCKLATIDEIKTQGWSLNPGRYVGVAEGAADEFDFKERLQELNEELEILNAESSQLENQVAENVSNILDKT